MKRQRETDSAPGESRPRTQVAALVVFAVSLVLHGIVWLQYGADPFSTSYVSDALSYHEWALRIAEKGLESEPVFHQSPLFPLIMGSFGYLFLCICLDWLHCCSCSCSLDGSDCYLVCTSQ